MSRLGTSNRGKTSTSLRAPFANGSWDRGRRRRGTGALRWLEPDFGGGWGKLSDIVTMTVFMVDDRFDIRFLELRKEIFKDNFPASALINIHSLVPPYAMIEIQCVAVIA